MPGNDDIGSFGADIAAAVRAEFGRQNKRAIRLVDVLSVSTPTAYDRWHGRTSYSTEDLDKVADFLGISAYDLVASAERTSHTGVAAALPAPEIDVMAQPPRSTRPRRGAA